MARRTIYLDDTTELLAEAAELLRPGESFSALMQRGVLALLEQMPEAKQRAAFRRAAELLEQRTRARA